jgi:putative sigma-54 modulation protein
MNLQIRSHHATIPDDLHGHAERKLTRLERLLPRLDDVTVEVTHEETRSAAQRFRVHVTVHSAASVLRGDERAGDARTAFDRAVEVVVRQARRHMTRLHDRHRGSGTRGRATEAPAQAPVAEPEDDDEVDEYLMGKIVRVKRFEAKPMSAEEALAQMDLLGHDFFLFLDADTRDYALLYRRRDGDYGMLTPARG